MERELLASSLDALNVLAHDYRRKGKPTVIPRPGEVGGERASSPAEVAAFFGAG